MRSMRSTALVVTLAYSLLIFGATASKSPSPSPSTSTSPSSQSSKRISNDYDACVCGESGYSDGSSFSFSSDAWNAEGSGFQCLSVINGSSSTSAGFDATWNWPVSPDTVHSFPHVTFANDQLPISLNEISELRLAAVWALTAGNRPSKQTGIDDSIASATAKCNVAFDMFLDPDPDKSSSAIDANYEIMVWIGRVGSPYPLGYSSNNTNCYTQQLGSFNFTLYTGRNSRGTSVYTWVSPSNETNFDEDISPLLQYLWRNRLVSADVRLGLVEFGSETFHSAGNVTFSAGNLSMSIRKGNSPEFDLNPIGKGCAKPEGAYGNSTGNPKKDSGIREGGGLDALTITIVTWISMLVTSRHGEDVLAWLAATMLWRVCRY